MVKQVILCCIVGFVLGGSKRLKQTEGRGDINQVFDTVAKLINPTEESTASDHKILKRFERSAQDGYGAPQPSYNSASSEPLMPYRYGYAVQDSDCNDFNQQEQSDGDQVVF